MKYLLLTITLVLGCSTINSQNYDFGKVSKTELEEKYHPKDSSASAAILYRNESISFFFISGKGFVQQREIHERVKVYNKDGFDWATKKEYLYQGTGNKEVLNGIKAFSYNLVDGKVVKDKLKKDGEFEEKYNEFTKIKSFTLPNVKEGTVIEYKYKISSPRISIDDIVFQYSVPVNKIDVKIATPEYYIYNKQPNLRASYMPKISETSVNRSNPFDYMVNIININEENIPALKKEAYSGNINNYRSKMSLELTAVLNGNKLLEKSYSSTWEEVSKTIYKSSNFGGQLDKFNFYKEDLKTLLAGVENDFEKAALVERLVKSKVKWNGRYGKYAQKGIRSAYKEGEGNVGDINLMLISMLRSQGVNANPVLVSTRDNGIPLFPTHDGFNYVVCSVEKEDKFLIIDATEEYSGNNILPQRVLNWQGRLIKDGSVSRWISMQPNKKSVETTTVNLKINDDFTATGKVSNQFTDYLAYFYRDKYVGLTTEDHIKALEKDKGDIEIGELTFENTKDINKPVKVNYEYELSDGLDEVGDKLYFSPLFFLATKENPFKLEERQYPIDFVIPYKDKYTVNIMLPEGYVVEFLPKSEALVFENSNIKFTYVIRQSGKYLMIKAELDINNPLVQAKDYKYFKAFFSKIIEKQAEQVVLTKA